MTSTEFEERPIKKRRFFVDDSPDLEQSPQEVDPPADPAPAPPSLDTTKSEDGFDVNLLNTFLGERLPESTVQKLRELSQNDIERGKFRKKFRKKPFNIDPNLHLTAVNIYLDGSWKTPQRPSCPLPSHSPQFRNGLVIGHGPIEPQASSPDIHSESSAPRPRKPSQSLNTGGYLGAFGVTAWATRSGVGLITYGEKVRIERAKPQAAINRLGIANKVGRSNAKRQDVVVRFTNPRGEEVGRFENNAAAWISTLIDQGTCRFEGSCVFAPDRVRTNDTIYLQLRCFILPSAFQSAGFVKASSNRQTGLFEVKESIEERELRLRQVALVKLFEEVKLQPSSSNEQTERRKREGLLQAAETAEQKDQKTALRPSQNGDSSPPSEEVEEGEELEQDQLDTLYKKAQSFDFNTPVAEPAETFTLTLRKYQKQALFWMMGKEKDEKSDHKEQSMHPLWDEYMWPTKDVDDNELPQVEGQECFYINPYSGELTLDFPAQDQNCLGGILADGTSAHRFQLALTDCSSRNGFGQNHRDVEFDSFAQGNFGRNICQ
jgi:DNA repair protein RAD5